MGKIVIIIYTIELKLRIGLIVRKNYSSSSLLRKKMDYSLFRFSPFSFNLILSSFKILKDINLVDFFSSPKQLNIISYLNNHFSFGITLNI